MGSGVVSSSRNQAGDEGAQQGFATSASVVYELEEAEVEWQLVLRDAPMRAKPGAQQRPEAFDRVDVHLAKAVAVLVAGILTASMNSNSKWLLTVMGSAVAGDVIQALDGASGHPCCWRALGLRVVS